MKLFKFAPIAIILALFLGAAPAHAKADTVGLFVHAFMTGDVPVLEKVLAPNFWYIAANGHIRDKEHFIQEVKDKHIVVDRITLLNERETKLGDTRLITANGVFHGKSNLPMPEGLMRYTMALARHDGNEQVVLFQSTPVISTDTCKDGNCQIK